MKKILPLLIIVLALGALILIYTKNSNTNKVDSDVDSQEVVPAQNNFAAAQSEKTISEENSDWIINATYPVSSNAQISNSIEETIEKIVSDFKNTDINSVLEESIQSTLGISYTTTESPKTVSYVFKIYSYGGGAHGVTSMVTRVFDIQTGNRIGLRDIFVDGYFVNLREELRAKLTETLGDSSTKDAIESGTALEDYIENFYLTNTAIGFVFSSYSVGPYAIGVVDVQIPFVDLESILMIERVK